MKYVEIMGYLATIISISSFLPIFIKQKKTNNFPYRSLILELIK
jgi:hypothetical protein